MYATLFLMGTIMGEERMIMYSKNALEKILKELQNRQAMQKNQNDVRNSTIRMDALLDNNNNTIENKQAELLRLIDGANESMEESILKQNRINKLLLKVKDH